jgi:hypothetical protein
MSANDIIIKGGLRLENLETKDNNIVQVGSDGKLIPSNLTISEIIAISGNVYDLYNNQVTLYGDKYLNDKLIIGSDEPEFIADNIPSLLIFKTTNTYNYEYSTNSTIVVHSSGKGSALYTYSLGLDNTVLELGGVHTVIDGSISPSGESFGLKIENNASNGIAYGIKVKSINGDINRAGLFEGNLETDNLYINTFTVSNSGNFLTWDHTGKLVDSGYNGSNISGSPTSLTTSITSDLSVGAIVAGDVIPSGTDLEDFINLLIKTTFYPTFTAPSFSLSKSISNTIEIGTIINVTLTANLNRGAITGNLSSGIWNPSLFQNYRSGTASSYIINSINNGTNNILTINNYQIVPGNQNWSATANYNIGPQPLDSKGNNYLTPLAAGSLNATSSNTNGVRLCFWGTDNSITLPNTSVYIRALSNNSLNPSNGTTFSISIPIGTQTVIFAYPNTLQAVSSVKYVEGLNAEVKGIFTLVNFNVESANAYDSISYKIYYYSPAVPFSAIATYNVTI